MTTSSNVGRRDALIDAASARPGNDPIFTLNGEARRRAAAGEDILNATLGALMSDDGRLATMQSANDAFAAVPPDLAAGYAPIAGTPAFIEAVLDDLFVDPVMRGQALAVATPGATGALHHAVQNFLDVGQALLTTSHYWGPYSVIAQHAGRRVDTFRMFTDAMTLNLDALASSLTEHIEAQGRSLLILNFPCHNPTGYSLTPQEWTALGELVREAGTRGPVTVVVDHAYARFGGADANGWVPALPRMLETATVLVCWTASKSFTQYGARVGALVAVHPDEGARDRIGNALNYSCRATFSNCNHRGLLAVTELLTNPEMRRRSDSERAELVALLNRRVQSFNEAADGTGLLFPRYEGGFFVSVLVPDPQATAARMREDGVYVVPSAQALRLALCATPTEQVPRLVDSLARAVG